MLFLWNRTIFSSRVRDSFVRTSGFPRWQELKKKLSKGAKVADIGCGLGTSSILMAEKFPNSIMHDFHAPSIEEARKRAESKGLENLEFFVADAAEIRNEGYDLACIFDAWHDMGSRWCC